MQCRRGTEEVAWCPLKVNEGQGGWSLSGHLAQRGGWKKRETGGLRDRDVGVVCRLREQWCGRREQDTGRSRRESKA